MRPSLKVVVVGFIVAKPMIELARRLVVGIITEDVVMAMTINMTPIPQGGVVLWMETTKSCCLISRMPLKQLLWSMLNLLCPSLHFNLLFFP